MEKFYIVTATGIRRECAVPSRATWVVSTDGALDRKEAVRDAEGMFEDLWDVGARLSWRLTLMGLFCRGRLMKMLKEVEM